MAYDVPDDRRRTRIAHILESYGERAQYSVFVVDGRPAQFVRLRRALTAAMDSEWDALLFCDLGPVQGLPRRRFEQVGRQTPLMGEGPVIV